MPPYELALILRQSGLGRVTSPGRTPVCAGQPHRIRISLLITNTFYLLTSMLFGSKNTETQNGEEYSKGCIYK